MHKKIRYIQVLVPLQRRERESIRYKYKSCLVLRKQVITGKFSIEGARAIYVKGRHFDLKLKHLRLRRRTSFKTFLSSFKIYVSSFNLYVSSFNIHVSSPWPALSTEDRTVPRNVLALETKRQKRLGVAPQV